MSLFHRFSRSTAACLLLAACALLSVLLYYRFLVQPYPLLQYYATPLLDLGKLASYRDERAWEFMLAFTALFLLYAIAYAVVRFSVVEGALQAALAAGAPIVFCAILIWTYPIGANDVFDYTFHGRMLAQYHLSPLSHSPWDVRGDGWLTFVAWPAARAPYGPLWAYAAATVYSLAGDNLLANVLGFKLLAVMCLLLCAGIVYVLLQSDGQGRRRLPALAGFVFIAWNPLLLVEMAANAHNDGLMLVFVLLAVYLHRGQMYLAAIIAAVVAGLVKAPAFVLVPIIGVAALHAQQGWFERLRFLTASTVASAAVAALIYLPLAQGSDLLGNLTSRQDLFTSSFAALELMALRLSLKEAAAMLVAQRHALIVFACALSLLLLRLDDSSAAFRQAAFRALLLLLVVLAVWFQPWYIMWIVALAPLAGPHSRTTAAVFSWSALWNYFVFMFAWHMNPDMFNRGDTLVLNSVAVLLVFGPPLVCIAANSIAARRTAVL